MPPKNMESTPRDFGNFSPYIKRILGEIKDSNGTGRDAINEIRNCKKTSHWMWYIFPQLQGFGFSEMSKFYGLKNLEEAKLYINHKHIGKYLTYITRLTLKCLTENNSNLQDIFGSIDKDKFLSCMTLFYYATLDNQELNELFDACKNIAEQQLKKQDKKTIELCEKEIVQRGGKINF